VTGEGRRPVPIPGPNFVGTSTVVASVTSWGDGSCRALDQTQRVDTPSVRSFLKGYVALP
jgi:hypothetical protein